MAAHTQFVRTTTSTPTVSAPPPRSAPATAVPLNTEGQELITAWGLVLEAVGFTSARLAEGLERAGVNAPFFDVLVRLAREPSQRLPMTKLATEVSLTSGGFTKLADRMEQEGLLYRQHSAQDRRVIYAVLTDAVGPRPRRSSRATSQTCGVTSRASSASTARPSSPRCAASCATPTRPELPPPTAPRPPTPAAPRGADRSSARPCGRPAAVRRAGSSRACPGPGPRSSGDRAPPSGGGGAGSNPAGGTPRHRPHTGPASVSVGSRRASGTAVTRRCTCW